MTRPKPPSPGTLFLVPLRDGGYACGLLARASGTGQALGYFFGPRVRSLHEIEPTGRRPADAILVGKFGDLELVRGGWPVGPKVEPWVPAEWPMPRMARIDEAAGRAWLSTYDDAFKCVEEHEIVPGEAVAHVYDRLMGAGSVELRLTKAIGALEEGSNDEG